MMVPLAGVAHTLASGVNGQPPRRRHRADRAQRHGGDEAGEKHHRRHEQTGKKQQIGYWMHVILLLSG
jgi:hypothetical protein